MLLSTGRKVVSPTRLRATGSAERTWPRKPQEVGMRLLFPFREVRHCWWRSSHQSSGYRVSRPKLLLGRQTCIC